MLSRLSPVEYVRPTKNGKTKPLRLLCETLAGDELIEVIAKFSAGCDEGISSLAREVVAACLAGDVGLAVPEAFLIVVDPAWSAVISDPADRARVQASSPVAFGSKNLSSQYIAWSRGHRVSRIMLPMAAAIFVFDAITQNVDRQSGNPNCLVKGDEIRIFDHEMSFAHNLIINWRPPWSAGGLNDLQTPGAHIFYPHLRRRKIDFAPIRSAWAGLSDAQVAAYGAAVPAEWAGSSDAINRALILIREARDNIDACLAEVRRILT